jgi:hypothetical protein
MKRNKKVDHFFPVTYISGMAYLFVSLWLLSVFGNFGTLEVCFTGPLSLQQPASSASL